MGARGLPVRGDLAPAALRRLAWREPDRAAGRRMLAVAHALDGMGRAEAARLAGMERQALRDVVVRCNAQGVGGLRNRSRPPRPGKLDEAELCVLPELALGGPDPELDGLPSCTWPGLCRVVEGEEPSTA